MKISFLYPFFARAQEFGENSGSVRLEAPALDSEEGGNWHIAPHLLCDACRIISAEINKKINFEISKVNKIIFKNLKIVDFWSKIDNLGPKLIILN